MAIELVTCPACNGQIQVESNNEFGYCSFCGNKIRLREVLEIRKTNIGIASGDSRITALNEMVNLIEYFEQTKKLYYRMYENNTRINKIKDPLITDALKWVGIILVVIGLFLEMAGVIFIIVGILFLAGFLYAKWMKKNKIENINKENYEIKVSIANIYNAYANCPLGIEYTNPQTLAVLYDLIRQGRAYSIKEALNMYLDKG